MEKQSQSVSISKNTLLELAKRNAIQLQHAPTTYSKFVEHLQHYPELWRFARKELAEKLLVPLFQYYREAAESKKVRICIPVRLLKCTHVDVLDLDFCFESVLKEGYLECPICGIKGSPCELYVDNKVWNAIAYCKNIWIAALSLKTDGEGGTVAVYTEEDVIAKERVNPLKEITGRKCFTLCPVKINSCQNSLYFELHGVNYPSKYKKVPI